MLAHSARRGQVRAESSRCHEKPDRSLTNAPAQAGSFSRAYHGFRFYPRLTLPPARFVNEAGGLYFYSSAAGVVLNQPDRFRFEVQKLKRVVVVMQAESGKRLPGPDRIVGESQPILELKHIIKRISQYDFPILIYGESGTGKELVAKAIHQCSSRVKSPLRTLNCAALSDSLLESELFGYVGGAFTGARRCGTPSLFETANRGSLFLDEVADLSAHAQAALLRVLEENEVVRVGGRESISIDVRVITASNRQLDKLVREGEFRHDLYHRLCVIPVHLPPLRKRRQDIPLLTKTILRRLGDVRYPGPNVMDYLHAYEWPGNVRELEHCVDYMVAVTDGPFMLSSLPPHLRAHVDIEHGRPSLEAPIHGEPDPLCDSRLVDDLHQEHLFILKVIDNNNRKGIGIGRRALALKAKQQGFSLTEGAIRSRLFFLRRQGLVQWGTGRAGTRLTSKGQSVVQELYAGPN